MNRVSADYLITRLGWQAVQCMSCRTPAPRCAAFQIMHEVWLCDAAQCMCRSPPPPKLIQYRMVRGAWRVPVSIAPIACAVRQGWLMTKWENEAIL